MNKFVKNFAQRLRDARIKSGLTQAQLGEKLGFKGNTAIYRFEAGISSPTIEILCQVAKILNTDLHILITGSPSPTVIRLVTSLRSQIEDTLTRLDSERSELKKKLLGFDLRRALSGEDNENEATVTQKLIDEIDAHYEALGSTIIEALKGNASQEGPARPIIKSSKNR